MATIAFDASVVDHTLPTYFAGLGAAQYRSTNDFPQAGYRSALQNLNPEVIRLNPWGGVGTVASPASTWQAMHDICAFLGSSVGVVMGPTSAATNASPSTKTDVDTTNYRADGNGTSPNDVAAWYEKFVLDGLTVLGIEFYNEPDNSVYSGNGSGPWFGDGVTITQANINKALTWAFQITRQYTAACATKAAAHGWTLPKINGAVVSGAQPYAQGWAKNFMAGTSVSGDTWPYADGNWTHFDVCTFHPYVNGSTDQARLNSITWDPAAFVNANDSVGVLSALHNLSAYAVANGHSDKRVAWNESGVDRGDAFAGLVDVAQAIIGCSYQKLYNIDYFTQWSMHANGTRDGSGIFPIMDLSYVLNTRACAMRDLAFYFSRNYKKQLTSGQTAVTGSGTTPSGGEQNASNNSVARIVAAVGLNAAGTKIGVLVANIDLSTAETVTVNITNATTTGNVTGWNLQQSTTTSGSTTLPTITPIVPTATSFSKSIEAGAAYLFEVPVTVSGGGGGSGGGTLPFPAASSTTIDDFNRANGDVGSNWALIQGDLYRPQISANTCVKPSQGFMRMVNLGAWHSSDQECYATIQTSDQYVDLYLRYDPDNDTGYLAEYESDTHNFNIYRVGGTGLFTFLGGAGTGRALVAGDVVGFRAAGATLTTWLNGTQVGTLTDPTPYLGAGRVGLGVGIGLDTFGGGGLQTPATASRRRGPRTGSGGGVR